jgi:hypothetical protein
MSKPADTQIHTDTTGGGKGKGARSVGGCVDSKRMNGDGWGVDARCDACVQACLTSTTMHTARQEGRHSTSSLISMDSCGWWGQASCTAHLLPASQPPATASQAPRHPAQALTRSQAVLCRRTTKRGCRRRRQPVCGIPQLRLPTQAGVVQGCLCLSHHRGRGLQGEGSWVARVVAIATDARECEAVPQGRRHLLIHPKRH